MEVEYTTDEFPVARQRPSLKAWALFVLTVIGLGAEIVQLTELNFFGNVMLTVAWVGLPTPDDLFQCTDIR